MKAAPQPPNHIRQRAAAYQNLPNLTTHIPPDQIGNSPKPAANLRDPARPHDLPRLTKTYQT